jgi:hypothetical protein
MPRCIHVQYVRLPRPLWLTHSAAVLGGGCWVRRVVRHSAPRTSSLTSQSQQAAAKLPPWSWAGRSYSRRQRVGTRRATTSRSAALMTVGTATRGRSC